MIWPFSRKKSSRKQAGRRAIFIWTLLICSTIAAIELPMPLEDLYRGARNLLRERPADQSIVVVAIDTKTSQAYGSSTYSRLHNAEMLDNAFAAGARRVYFDEAFSLPKDQQGDQALADAFERYKGRAFSGAMFFRSSTRSEREVILPATVFQGHTTIRSLRGVLQAFGLSAELSLADDFNGLIVPSVSADIAGRSGNPGDLYRPDWTIQVDSIPTVSLVDLAKGLVPAEVIRGKDLIVGVSNDKEDIVHIYGQGWFPGVYVHAVGAQTLREGNPRDIGWIPGILVAAAFALALLRTRRQSAARAITVTAVALGIVLPFVLDVFLVTADFIAAYLLFGIIARRAATLREINEARLKNAGSLLPNLSALREEVLAAQRPIIAMRIRNYAAVCSSFATPVEDELVTELARRLTLPNGESPIYQAEDVLYWLGPTLSGSELVEHLTGLARLIESHFEIRGRKLDIHIAFGVDIDLDRQVGNRIGRALLAADNAAAKHQLVQFSTNTSDDDTAWELSLMSELDAAIDAGDIWIAYQPQFDLQTGSICGAESLVRWQHPTRGAISPETFVLPAESHNRIARLTFHILEQATRAARPLLALDPRFRLSVNLSASLLERPQLPATIAQILIASGFPATNLTLEVTESAPFSEHTIVSNNLAGIAAIGIDLSIDDYGTGNATLEYLRTVPCQEIKIDRSFVGGLRQNASDMLLVESTIELAHGLGRRVIAEGIEDGDTLDTLRAIGCDIGQGYYLAKPMRLDALETLLATAAQVKAA